MKSYFLKRVLATLPTLFGISIVCFFLIHLTPGGPVEQFLAEMRRSVGESGASTQITITQEQRKMLEAYYGFDKPILERYVLWLFNLSQFHFGESYYFEIPVSRILLERLPVSLIFGAVSFFLTYLICIPLGILKALRQGSLFDIVTSAIVFLLYSIPSFALGIFLIVLFCGGSFWSVFPIQGFHSSQFEKLSFFAKIIDIAYHMFLPLLCYCAGQFAFLTLLMKNSLLEQIQQDYVTTARAKGLPERQVILNHAVRNALLPIASGFGQWLAVFFSGSLLIETLFNLQGIGRLSYESILHRDYPVVLAVILILSLLHIIGNLISDLLYTYLDPRIDYK